MIARAFTRRLVLAAAIAALPGAGFAAEDRWCRDGGWDDHPTHCEVREVMLPAGRERIEVDSSPNGGIEVEGWDRGQVRVMAKVVARGDTEEDARELASRVQIDTAGVVRAQGPRGDRHRHWSVSYRLHVPSGVQLSLNSVNGGISLRDVTGSVDLRTVNGGVHVNRAAGRVTGRTTNGGLHVQLDGNAWDGEGLNLETSNGGVTLMVPEGYNAQLETGTVNGGLNLDFPLTVQGQIKRRINVTLGRGGSPIRAVTTNGGITLRRP